MKKVGIIMGSDSDLPIVQKAVDTLKSFGVPYEVHIFSAHRTPDAAAEFSKNAQNNGFGVLIAAAGMAAVFCGVTNCPITSVLIAFELFGFEGVPYYLIAVSVSYAFSGYYSLYKTQTIVYSKYKAKYINRKAKS